MKNKCCSRCNNWDYKNRARGKIKPAYIAKCLWKPRAKYPESFYLLPMFEDQGTTCIYFKEKGK